MVHDVGLIAGTEYIRQNEKAFILSQEISVNKYSHSKPTLENLPLAKIRYNYKHVGHRQWWH